MYSYTVHLDDSTVPGLYKIELTDTSFRIRFLLLIQLLVEDLFSLLLLAPPPPPRLPLLLLLLRGPYFKRDSSTLNEQGGSLE